MLRVQLHAFDVQVLLCAGACYHTFAWSRGMWYFHSFVPLNIDLKVFTKMGRQNVRHCAVNSLWPP